MKTNLSLSNKEQIILIFKNKPNINKSILNKFLDLKHNMQFPLKISDITFFPVSIQPTVSNLRPVCQTKQNLVNDYKQRFCL